MIQRYYQIANNDSLKKQILRIFRILLQYYSMGKKYQLKQQKIKRTYSCCWQDNCNFMFTNKHIDCIIDHLLNHMWVLYKNKWLVRQGISFCPHCKRVLSKQDLKDHGSNFWRLHPHLNSMKYKPKRIKPRRNIRRIVEELKVMTIAQFKHDQVWKYQRTTLVKKIGSLIQVSFPVQLQKLRDGVIQTKQVRQYLKYIVECIPELKYDKNDQFSTNPLSMLNHKEARWTMPHVDLGGFVVFNINVGPSCVKWYIANCPASKILQQSYERGWKFDGSVLCVAQSELLKSQCFRVVEQQVNDMIVLAPYTFHAVLTPGPSRKYVLPRHYVNKLAIQSSLQYDLDFQQVRKAEKAVIRPQIRRLLSVNPTAIVIQYAKRFKRLEQEAKYYQPTTEFKSQIPLRCAECSREIFIYSNKQHQCTACGIPSFCFKLDFDI